MKPARTSRRWWSSCAVLFMGVVAWGTDSGQLFVLPCSYQDKHSSLVVDSVQLLCDSPGAYYAGSSAYRNSVTCKYGDTGHLHLNVTLGESFVSGLPSNLRFSLQVGGFNRMTQILYQENVCNLFILSLTSSDYQGSSCSTTWMPGDSYQMRLDFDMPSLHDDEQVMYTPDVKMAFYNTSNVLMGCAVAGTQADYVFQSSRSQRGRRILATAVGSFLAVFALLLWMTYRRKKRLEQQWKNRPKEQPEQAYVTLTDGRAIRA